MGRVLSTLACGLLAVGVLAAPGTASAAPAGPRTAPSATGPGARAACPVKPGPVAHCLSTYRTTAQTRLAPADVAAPDGWGATDLADAYIVPASADRPLVGIAIAYGDPALEQDLAVYREQYGLPPCGTGDGCLRIVNQRGEENAPPAQDFGWSLEETLDVSMVSASCPSCRILVVEADSAEFADLAAATDTAVRLGAGVVSHSYGARESGQAMRYSAHYQHPNATMVVASGDYGFTAASWPAALTDVLAVGGTELSRADNARGWSEEAWQYAGSGCSAYVAKPAWQHDTSCGGRTIADVSAASDGIALYYGDFGGWLIIGGTSASAPFVAGLVALAGHATQPDPGRPYRADPATLFDVTAGDNDPTGGGGRKCGGDYLCVAGPGYDGPTGVGTPNGTGAF